MWYTVSRSTGHLKSSRAFLSCTQHRTCTTHVVMILCPFIVCVFIANTCSQAALVPFKGQSAKQDSSNLTQLLQGPSSVSGSVSIRRVRWISLVDVDE